MTATQVADQVRELLRVRSALPSPAERRRLRQASGLSQQALADIIGVTRGAISHWELGVRSAPRGDLLNRYSEALRILGESL